jgi:hypothetical protein
MTVFAPFWHVQLELKLGAALTLSESHDDHVSHRALPRDPGRDCSIEPDTVNFHNRSEVSVLYIPSKVHENQAAPLSSDSLRELFLLHSYCARQRPGPLID